MSCKSLSLNMLLSYAGIRDLRLFSKERSLSFSKR